MDQGSLKRADDINWVALDPGETTGWATFDSIGQVIEWGQFKQKEQLEWLKLLISTPPNLKGVIYEDYVNFGFKQQKRWSRNQTSKNIGSIETMCDLRGIPYYKQPANIKAIGYKWAGLGAAPSNHDISHQYDAVVHGVYWLTNNKIRSPMLNVPKG